MARVENGRIYLSIEEFKLVKGSCGDCPLSNICGGLDSKITGADIHPNITENPSDEDITSSASCLKRILSDKEVGLSKEDQHFINNHVVELSNLSPEEYKKFGERIVSLFSAMSALAEFLHPDNGLSSDSFNRLFKHPRDILIELSRQSKKLRSNRE